MTDFQRENRYIVIKRSHASEDALSRLEGTMDNNGVTEVEDALVVESDWPEYETVWQMIEARVTGGDNHIAISRHSKCLIEQLRTQLAERDKMLAEFACELTLALTDSQVRAAMTQVGRTKCMELLQRYNQREAN